MIDPKKPPTVQLSRLFTTYETIETSVGPTLECARGKDVVLRLRFDDRRSLHAFRFALSRLEMDLGP